MTIIQRQKVEDCFDGSGVWEYRFETAWTRADIDLLGPLGRLEYFGDFPRPLFRVHGPAGLQIKGVEGENSCRVVFPRTNRDALRESFESVFSIDPSVPTPQPSA